MTTSKYSSQSSVGKTRRAHHKSRDGCLECKRRRVKCDEMKPACMRCTLSLDKCIYSSTLRSAAKSQKDELPLPDLPCSLLSPLSNAPSYPTRSPSLEASAPPTPEFADPKTRSNAMEYPEGVSDTDLYHHYLQHTSRTLAHCQRDQSALQIGMPTLALQSKTVFHSLLAAAAACLGWDMISKEPPPDISAVNKVLMAGYRHYNLASERMRESISRQDTLKLEPLLASALMLVPFATASQQINHWVSARSEARNPHKLLSSTPRDIIIIMRGIRTTLQTLDCGSLSPGIEPPVDKEPAIDGFSASSEDNARPAAPTTSRTHVMFPIIATTCQKAFSKLQQRLESAFLYRSDTSKESLSACSAAFKVLGDISNSFSASNQSSYSSIGNPTDDTFEPKSVSLPQAASWLRSFARRSVLPLPTGPLTRFFLNFLVQAPQAYLDLVLPLLDQRLEDPIGTAPERGKSTELTIEQALALDIYAHWSVLMFLVEDESWWIGNLPIVTLSGMVNAYGYSFVNRMWPQNGAGQEHWWPGSMLNILREIKRHQ